MIKQGIVNDSILEKKFKILRTSIMLGNVKNSDEMLSSYEETAREIDQIKCNLYEELLASRMYTTDSLEEERDRLSELIDFIQKRIDERNDFIDDYIKVTSNFLDGLPRVYSEEELPQYRNRLNTINEYLNNCEEINRLGNKLKDKRQELEEKYENKASNELINDKLENELIEEFNKLTSKDEYYNKLNYTDIDNELVKIDSNLEDKKEVMNTFVSSYDALKNAGISGSEKEEYLSYVNDAKKDYYSELDKKYMLNIYKLVLDKESDYDLLYQKRLYIENILKDRLKSRVELGITSYDPLEYFSDVCNEQFSIIKSQKINIENIERLVVEIAETENRLDELDNANDRSEIKELLNEYSSQKPEIEKVELPVPEEIKEDVVKKTVTDNSRPSNMVVNVSEPVKINVKSATDTAKLVMKKVVIVLEPKRFNSKKDKLKEAEKELEKENSSLSVNEETTTVDGNNGGNSLNDTIKNEEEKVIENPDIFNTDDTFITLDNNNSTDSNYDDVFVSDNININLDTKEMDNVKGTIETNQININVPSNDVTIPTEIFIEEPLKEKKPDLFSQTDPFLDDNQFEIGDSSNNEETNTNIPKISNIGTVRPTSMLSKIEDATKENDDIILPTMGLTIDDKTSVPIVSENYIN